MPHEQCEQTVEILERLAQVEGVKFGFIGPIILTRDDVGLDALFQYFIFPLDASPDDYDGFAAQLIAQLGTPESGPRLSSLRDVGWGSVVFDDEIATAHERGGKGTYTVHNQTAVQRIGINTDPYNADRDIPVIRRVCIIFAFDKVQAQRLYDQGMSENRR